jgi:hypothetical protein
MNTSTQTNIERLVGKLVRAESYLYEDVAESGPARGLRQALRPPEMIGSAARRVMKLILTNIRETLRTTRHKHDEMSLFHGSRHF